MNKARLKKLITTWFYLYDILEKAKSQGGKTDQRLPGPGGGEGWGWLHESFFGC